MDQLWVPEFSEEFRDAIVAIVSGAKTQQTLAKDDQAKAENALRSALGLADWRPPERLAYMASSSDVFAAGRLDAQFFAPRIQDLVDHLSKDGLTVGMVSQSRRERFKKSACETFNYIEIGDVGTSGTVGNSFVNCADAPSRATWHVRSGDIITSTVRPIRRLSAMVMPDQDGFVCSSGFVVLQPFGVSPEVLLTFLRLPPVCELMDLYASASMYPAITEADILGLPFPKLDAEASASISESVQTAKEARARAIGYLFHAKRAVE